MHELLRRLGHAIDVHPENPTGKTGRPDFLAEASTGGPYYLEAALATDESDEDRSAQARKDAFCDALNRSLGPTDFFINMNMRGAPRTSPPVKEIRAQLRIWLSGLDADEVAEAAKAGRPRPRYKYDHDGWHVVFTASPRSAKSRGKEGIRPIGAQSLGARMSPTPTSIRDKMLAKARKYGALARPLVVAVNACRFNVERADVLDALFGDEAGLVPSSRPDLDWGVSASRTARGSRPTARG